MILATFMARGAKMHHCNEVCFELEKILESYIILKGLCQLYFATP